MAQFKGASRQHEIRASRRRKDTRRLGQKVSDYLKSGNGAVLTVLLLPVAGLVLIKVPFSGELMLITAWLFYRRFIRMESRAVDFPYRVPMLAGVRDGSARGGKELGKGITFLGNDLETREQIYATDSDLRTHLLVLGTTGSGKTEFLLGVVFNALVQNTGFIYVDGKGDPKFYAEAFRLARYLGREDDLLTINFVTSGRDFVDKQPDKVTNTMNFMGHTSSGMLIEFIVSLLDDSAGSGDMWKGRAITFVAALTRPLTYLRDKGWILLSPEKYIEYFELSAIEELVWEHNGKYGEMFDLIVAPLRLYLTTLPGYQKAKMKKQEQKTAEQHGFIVMQLTRVFNDLTFNYGHIFRTNVPDVDFFDVVMNRRLLVVRLPALERAPDSLRMLGKLIVGAVKQIMAGCLGNRAEGTVREIIDSRPTNAPVPFYCIFDEYGYYAVVGFAVAAAQARSLGFSLTFASQDFSSLKKSSAEEADATWENTNIRAIGRITSGQKSETWERIQGASGESEEARSTGFQREVGNIGERFLQQDMVSIDRRARLDYDDLAMQENGEFTFLMGKKYADGTGGVRVVRGMSFYTAGPAAKELRLNDFLPVEPPAPADLPQNKLAVEALMMSMVEGSFPQMIQNAIKGDTVLASMYHAFERNYEDPERPRLGPADAVLGVLGWYMSGEKFPEPQGKEQGDALSSAPVTKPPSAPSDPLGLQQAAATKALLNAADIVLAPSATKAEPPQVLAQDHDEIVNPEIMQTNVMMTDADSTAFRQQALPLLRQHLFMLKETPVPESWGDELTVADPDRLMEMEVASSGPFKTLEDKWAVEEQIDATRALIAQATAYPQPPAPDSISVADARQKLDSLSMACEALMKSALRKTT